MAIWIDDAGHLTFETDCNQEEADDPSDEWDIRLRKRHASRTRRSLPCETNK